MDDWQPIETAPKDGTTILIACRNRVTAGDWVEPRVFYVNGEPEYNEFDPYWQSWDGGFLLEGEHVATHWMPLPDPPKD